MAMGVTCEALCYILGVERTLVVKVKVLELIEMSRRWLRLAEGDQGSMKVSRTIKSWVIESLTTASMESKFQIDEL